MLALLAANAVALQAVLIVVAGPFAGATAFADQPVCSSLGTGAAGKGPDGSPAGHAHDCLAACLTGCSAAPPPETPLAVVLYAPRSTGTMTAAVEGVRTLCISATCAHRSRAPPLG